MNTFTDEDLTVLESLEFEPACEKSNHDSDEPATWAAIFAPVTACGCPTPGLMLWCDPCRNRNLRAGGVVCACCGAILPQPESPILRFEPLR